MVAAVLGRVDEGFEWLGRAFAERDTFLFILHGATSENNWLRVNPDMLTDPRVEALWRRMGFP